MAFFCLFVGNDLHLGKADVTAGNRISIPAGIVGNIAFHDRRKVKQIGVICKERSCVFLHDRSGDLQLIGTFFFCYQLMVQTIAACKVIQGSPEKVGIFGIIFQTVFQHASCQCINGGGHGCHVFRHSVFIGSFCFAAGSKAEEHCTCQNDCQ